MSLSAKPTKNKKSLKMIVPLEIHTRMYNVG